MVGSWKWWRSASGVVLTLTLGLLCVPVLVDLVRSPRQRPFGYAAADAFYYLTVARNAVRSGSFSFDGEHSTNGFHPLWQGVCAALYFVTESIGVARHVVLVVIVASLLLLAGGVLLLGLAWCRWSGRLSPAFLVLPVGGYALCLIELWARCRPVSNLVFSYEGPLPLYGTLWSFVNGMESGCVLLAFGGLAYLAALAAGKASHRIAWAFGVVAALFTLARLDHVLIALPIVGGFVAKTWLDRARRGEVVRALAGFGAPFAAYLLFNRVAFGNIMPASGQVKTTFPYPTADNLRRMADLWEVTSCESFHDVFRQAQIVIPMLAALGVLPVLLGVSALPSGFAVHLRRPAAEGDRFLALTAVGVLALGSYNLLFAEASVQGHWYFPVSTLFVSLVLVNLVERVPWSPPLALQAVAALAMIAGSIVCFTQLHRRAAYHSRWADFYWNEAPRVQAHYGGRRPKLVEFDDGIVNFSLDFRAMSHALMLDPAGVKAYQQQRLLPLAVSRGFDRITTFTYRNAQELGSPRKARGWVADMFPGERLDGFEFEVDYLSSDKSFGIVRMSRAGKK
jgi:hypothetical protein